MTDSTTERVRLASVLIERMKPDGIVLNDGDPCVLCKGWERRPWPYGPDAEVLIVENVIGETLLCQRCYSRDDITKENEA